MQEPPTAVTLEDIIRDLAMVISAADGPTEQTNENLRVVILVFRNIATSLNIILPTEINVQVRIIDEIEVTGAHC